MTEQSQVIDKLHGINVYLVHFCNYNEQIIILIQDFQVSLSWNTCVVCLLLFLLYCVHQEKLRMRNVYPPLNLTINLFVPELSVIKKRNEQVQKITCKFACFLSSGLGVVDL